MWPTHLRKYTRIVDPAGKKDGGNNAEELGANVDCSLHGCPCVVGEGQTDVGSVAAFS